MESKNSNPLAKYFRQPAIYLKLPSKGRYWVPGTINLPPNGEIPVYPMTAQDEIMLKTPDALMNGEGIVNVMQSCCPNILDAWKMPSVDIDAVLLSIRIASYGSNMEFDVKCPECKSELSYAIAIQPLLESIVMPEYQPVRTKGLTITLKPQPYFSVNNVSIRSYEEGRVIQLLNDKNTTDKEKKSLIEQQVNRLSELSIQSVTQSTESISTIDGTVVTDVDQIAEFYRNCENKVIKDIQSKLSEITDAMSIKPQTATCQHCNTQFEIPLEFNNSNFFV